MQNKDLKVALLQYDIAWEDKLKNITYISKAVSKLSGKADIAILPEMCTTGFTFNVQTMAESPAGETLTQLKEIARKFNIALCGSFLCVENEKYYNRGFFLTPIESYFYDKRHLFRMGQEGLLFTAGNKKTIVEYKGFNINLLICYDLRFPVWARNIDNQYDLLIYVANWPEARKNVWSILLKARAIENMCYVCGVNRIGEDNNGLNHVGMSIAVDARGQKIIEPAENKEATIVVTLDKEKLKKDRTHFPVWKDADDFEINI